MKLSTELLKYKLMKIFFHREGVKTEVKEKERIGGMGDRGHFHWLSGSKDMDEVIEVHKRIRRLVREEAGKLG